MFVDTGDIHTGNSQGDDTQKIGERIGDKSLQTQENIIKR